MPWLDKHVSAPGSINSKRITAKPAREAFVSMCACTEPVGTGIDAVCVEYGRLLDRVFCVYLLCVYIYVRLVIMSSYLLFCCIYLDAWCITCCPKREETLEVYTES